MRVLPILEINVEHDVPGLCNELPMRVEKLRLRRDRKLKKSTDFCSLFPTMYSFLGKRMQLLSE